MTRLIAVFFAVLLALMPAVTFAGSSEAAKAILPAHEVRAFSNTVQQNLAQKGAHVAIVARTGRDPDDLPAGINYTHVAYWVYSKITKVDGSTGTGYQVYNLYQKANDPSRSSLVQDTPADFFAGAYSLDAGVIIPTPKMQRRILEVIASPTYQALHNARYSVLANPNTSQFQNCTEHTLDVLMAGVYQTDDIPQIKANIAAYFAPQPINLGPMKRLFAPMASKALTTKDHGDAVSTTTFGSLARFMEQNDLATTVLKITPSGVKRF